MSLVPAGNPLRQLGLRYKVHCTGRLLAPLGSLPAHRLRSLRIDSGAVGEGGAPYCNPNLGELPGCKTLLKAPLSAGTRLVGRAALKSAVHAL